jgi:hypothetical protein
VKVWRLSRGRRGRMEREHREAQVGRRVRKEGRGEGITNPIK